MILSLVSIAIIVRYFSAILEIRKAYKEISKTSTIFTDKQTRNRMFAEIFITLLFIPPYLD